MFLLNITKKIIQPSSTRYLLGNRSLIPAVSFSTISKPFSIEESLYLASEAGINLPWEKQIQIMRSPSFSQNNDPFILENFFSTLERDLDNDIDTVVEDDPEKTQLTPHEDDTKFNTHVVPKVPIHEVILNRFNPKSNKTFLLNGREWLITAEGEGTCKRASAHVIIRRGTGQIRVNKDQDLYSRWPYYYNRMDIAQPFLLTKSAGEFDLFIHTKGGGVSGQSRAVRLAVGRALVNACPACEEDFSKSNVLYEDKRQKMPKMPGRLAARKMKSWSKR